MTERPRDHLLTDLYTGGALVDDEEGDAEPEVQALCGRDHQPAGHGRTRREDRQRWSRHKCRKARQRTGKGAGHCRVHEDLENGASSVSIAVLRSADPATPPFPTLRLKSITVSIRTFGTT